MQAKDFDILLYGASGFTGRQALNYLASNVLRPENKWAIAGRNLEKLKALVEKLPENVASPECLVAEASDRPAIEKMVSRTKLVLTTAGPFALYSAELAKACARQGVDYLDITGETPFVRELIDEEHANAQSSGAKMVPLCGFDSVPSDLGTLFTVRHLQEEYDEDCKELKLFFTLKGGLNGGTMASALDMMSKKQNIQLLNPTLLNPANHRQKEDAKHIVDLYRPYFDKSLQRWAAPFFMAHINSRVVGRSVALFKDLEAPYGAEFSYQEAMRMGKALGKVQAYGVTSAIAAMQLIGKHQSGRTLIDLCTPKPGSGPSTTVRENGFFRADIFACGSRNTKVQARVSAKGDPGNKVTITILCEAARCLLFKRDELPGGNARTGILTPATAFGHVLQERLEKVGMSFEIEKV